MTGRAGPPRDSLAAWRGTNLVAGLVGLTALQVEKELRFWGIACPASLAGKRRILRPVGLALKANRVVAK